jgi:uncharacterized protein (TIGR03435 family)
MEKREMPVLWLVLANKDGRLGPKLHRSTALPAAPPTGRFSATGMSYEAHVGFPSDGRLKNDWVRERLSQITQKMILDRTGLTGLFEAELRWTPDVPPVTDVPTGAPETAQAYDPGGPSFTTAIREQLGLRLENRRDSVDVLVIDRIEHPMEN